MPDQDPHRPEADVGILQSACTAALRQTKVKVITLGAAPK